jgi:hypothetical protein
MYEVHNYGGWYNLGFLLGVIFIFGGTAASTRGSNRCGSRIADIGRKRDESFPAGAGGAVMY